MHVVVVYAHLCIHIWRPRSLLLCHTAPYSPEKGSLAELELGRQPAAPSNPPLSALCLGTGVTGLDVTTRIFLCGAEYLYVGVMRMRQTLLYTKLLQVTSLKRLLS